jgi:hypothetical protein
VKAGKSTALRYYDISARYHRICRGCRFTLRRIRSPTMEHENLSGFPACGKAVFESLFDRPGRENNTLLTLVVRDHILPTTTPKLSG